LVAGGRLGDAPGLMQGNRFRHQAGDVHRACLAATCSRANRS
jgi:hypothetical protein